jgi:hypothetical protein
MPLGLDRLAQLPVQRFYGIHGVDHAPDFGREREGRVTCSQAFSNAWVIKPLAHFSSKVSSADWAASASVTVEIVHHARLRRGHSSPFALKPFKPTAPSRSGPPLTERLRVLFLEHEPVVLE